MQRHLTSASTLPSFSSCTTAEDAKQQKERLSEMLKMTRKRRDEKLRWQLATRLRVVLECVGEQHMSRRSADTNVSADEGERSLASMDKW